MDRAAQENQVRLVKRTCRGLPVLDEPTRTELHTKWQQIYATGNWDSAMQVVKDAERAAGIKGIPDGTPGDWEELWRRAASAIFAHGDTIGKGCGYDFNETICAGAFDGEQHAYTCPKCGQTGKYGAPYFENDEGVASEIT